MLRVISDIIAHATESAPPFDFAKEGAVFHDSAMDSRPRRITQIDRVFQTLTYEPIGEGNPFSLTVPDATFNLIFVSWVEDESNEHAEFYTHLRELSTVWDEAHRENEERTVRKAVAEGDAETILGLLNDLREKHEGTLKLINNFTRGEEA